MSLHTLVSLVCQNLAQLHVLAVNFVISITTDRTTGNMNTGLPNNFLICLPSLKNVATTRTEMRKTMPFNYAIENVTNDIENVVSKAQVAHLKLAPTGVNWRCSVNNGLVPWKHNYLTNGLEKFCRQK